MMRGALLPLQSSWFCTMMSSVVTHDMCFVIVVMTSATARAASIRLILKHFEVLQQSGLHSHSVRRRDVQTETHLEKVLSFHALQRSEVTVRTKTCKIKTLLSLIPFKINISISCVLQTISSVPEDQ